MYYPKEINGKWFAERKVRGYHGAIKKEIYRDMFNEPLDLISQEWSQLWCDTKNAIDRA